MPNKILLADDSITIQKVVNLTFTDEGINVVTVGNGELAIKKLGEDHFDLVLADIFMPGRNGYEVCEHVKTSPEYAGVPVLLLVGAFEPFDKSEASRVRADGHLTKPFESRVLIETVKRLLAEATMRKAVAAPAPPPPPEPAPAYQGHVVGWDVPTAPVVVQSYAPEFEEHAPPDTLYDPYASTQKLPAVGVEGDSPVASALAEATASFGTPASSDSVDEVAAAASAEPGLGAMQFDEGIAPPFDVAPVGETRPLEGPPDSVSGFSYAVDAAPPLEAAVDPEVASGPAATDGAYSDTLEQPVGYQEIHESDSPLDLPDLKLVEPAPVEAFARSERDPLLETFADVAESTIRVDAEPVAGLEPTARPDGEPSLEVGPTDGVISAWDREAQPERSAEDAIAEPIVAEAAAAGAPDAHDARTQALSLADAPFSHDAEFEPAAQVEEAPASSPEGAPTMLFSLPAEGVAAFDAEAAEPAAPVDEAPEVVEETDEGAVAAPVNGSGAAGTVGGIPQDLIDEVVRRTVERMSDDVIREIAWEVVPDLAERLIRKRLGEQQ